MGRMNEQRWMKVRFSLFIYRLNGGDAMAQMRANVGAGFLGSCWPLAWEI